MPPTQPQPGAMPQMPQGLPQMPPGMPEAPAAPMGDQPITEEQRQKMADLIENIRGELEHVKAITFAAEDETRRMKQDLLQQVFKKMELVGIDLEDQGSVAGFIEELRGKSPELAAQFESAMNFLLDDSDENEYEQGEEIDAPVDLADDPRDNEMNNENIPQDPRGLPPTSVG